jgi:diguanylate cyclase (GGDEF)-like protein/PAS domain S-box-containing protein
MRIDRFFSPTWRVALGLAALVASLLLLADFLFGILPDREAEARRVRTVVAESVTTQITEHLRRQETARVAELLQALRSRNPDLLSAGVRRADGQLLASAGAHAPNWADLQGNASSGQRVLVPILSSQGQWGRTEFEFAAVDPTQFSDWLRDKRLWLALLLPLAGLTLIYLYLRRTLMQLNPMSVVPERLRDAFDSLTEGVALLDLQGRVVLANEALRRMAGVGSEGLHGRPFATSAQLQLDPPGSVAPWLQVLQGAGIVRGTRVYVGEGSRRRTGVLNCSPIADPSGRVRGCLATIGDVTEIEHNNHELRRALADLEQSRLQIEAQNQELIRLATRDSLTGLFNRRSFFDSAAALVAQHAQRGERFAVMMLDVDHFKAFNDEHGHALGDLVLQNVARQIEDTLRQQDLLARYGGEEFCALLSGVSEEAALALAERVRTAVQRQAGRGLLAGPDGQPGRDLVTTISIGLCVAPAGAQDLSRLLQQADEALYQAKRAGRNRVALAQAVPA